jgi:hypothetical protein
VLASFWAHGEGRPAKFVFLYIGVPALLAIAGARFLRTRTIDGIIGAVGAASMGAVVWFLVLLWLASQGVFEH